MRIAKPDTRHRAGLRVGTALTEGTANFLVNRRMNKSQQMRWSRRGADRLLQVRCAVYNGTLGTGFGQRFYAVNDALPPVAAAGRPPLSRQSRGRLTPNFATVPLLARRGVGRSDRWGNYGPDGWAQRLVQFAPKCRICFLRHQSASCRSDALYFT